MNIHKLPFCTDKYILLNNNLKQTVSFSSGNTQDRFEKQNSRPIINSHPTSTIPQLMKGFFANNNPEIEETLANADFSQFGKLGLPLAYTRKDFLADLTNILKDATEQEKNDILNKLNITLIKNKSTVDYNGIIDLSQLSSVDIEGKVLSIATRFIKENSILTDDEKLNKILNSLIQGIPEFINIIGKQKANENYSLDVYTLIILKEIINNPKYQNLSNQEKTCIKFATILHDIAKAENANEEDAKLCALYAKIILGKITLPYEIKDRIYELVKNYHWFENWNKKTTSRIDISTSFRRTNDFKIAQIITESILTANNNTASIPERLKEAIEIDVNVINGSGQIFLTSKIVDPKKIPTVQHNGKEYKVINFAQLPKNFDLFQFGFAPGATTENLRVWMHMIPNSKLSNLESICKWQEINNEGFLCASYGTIENFKTFSNRLYGFSLEAEQVNIANASDCDQNSNIKTRNFGETIKRGFNRFKKIIIGLDDVSEYRYRIPESIMETLNLSEIEYSSLYAQIQKYKHPSQLDNVPEIEVEGRIFTGKEIKEAILKANDTMLIKDPRPLDCNEGNLYSPKINAVVAKVASLGDIPQQLLNFAQKYNLPIYLFGEN